MARRFIWIALSAVGIPACVIKALVALYANNIHYFSCASGLRFAFVARAGVRQGCPLSSTIFVIVTDCMIRALISVIGCGDILRGYADDIALVVSRIWDVGPRISTVFEVIGRVSQLHLNGKKCVFIPLWHYNAQKVALNLEQYIPHWRNFLIRSFGKYLGFLIGPGAINQEWDCILSKILDAATLIKSLGLPKLQGLFLYQMLGASQVQFVAQLRSPPRGMRRFELGAMRSLIGGPGLWASAEMFHNLKEQCGFPVSIQALGTLCRAAMIRTAYCTVPDFQNGLKVIAEGGMCEEASLLHPFKDWLDNCATMKLKEACDQFNVDEFRIWWQISPDMPLRNMNRFQGKLYSFLLPRWFPFDIICGLEAKFQRWYANDNARIFAERAVTILKSIQQEVPPCVIFALLATCCNAWCTAKRFQGRTVPFACRLCSDCGGEDSLEHYARCPLQWQVFKNRLGRSSDETLTAFMALDCDHVEDMVFHACHVYAVKQAVDTGRIRGIANSVVQASRRIWQGHRTAAIHNKSLSARYHRIWHD